MGGTALIAGVGGLALYGALKPSEEKTVIIHQGETAAAPAAAPAPAAPVAVAPAPAPAVPVAAAPAPVVPAVVPETPAVPVAPVVPAPVAVAPVAAVVPVETANVMPAVNPGVPFAPVVASVGNGTADQPQSPDSVPQVPLAPLLPTPVPNDAQPSVPLAPLPVMVNPCQPDQNGHIPPGCISSAPLAASTSPPLIHNSVVDPAHPNTDLTLANNATVPNNSSTSPKSSANNMCIFHLSVYSALALLLIKFF